MSIKAQVVDSVSLGSKIAGFGAVGLVIEDVSGYPGTFWIAALIGAILVRRPLEGVQSERAKLRSILCGLGIAWMGTAPLLDFLGLATAVYQTVLAGALAAFGEQVVTVMTDPNKMRRWVDMWKGRK